MRLILIFLLVSFATKNVMADTTRAEKLAYIVQTEGFREQIVGYQEEMFRRSRELVEADADVELNEEVREIIAEESSKVVQEVVDDYIKEVVELYNEKLTENEINALYGFYQTSEGKSFGSKLPEISRETFWIDARYLEMISERAVSRIEERLSE